MFRTLARPMLLLSETDVRKCLPLKECLEANRKALIAVANGTAQVPTRLGLSYQGTGTTPDWTLFKPASIANDETLMGMKVVSIRDGNPSKGLPTVPATVVNIEPETGYVNAVLSATYMTAARTAAGSALSCALIRPNLKHVVVFGAGLQADLHMKLIATAINRPIPKVTIINRSEGRALELKESMPKEYATEISVTLLKDQLAVAETLSTADIVVTATNTTTPLFEGSHLPPGCHISGVGSYTPEMQEVSARTVDRCRVLIDTPEAMQVGDLRHLNHHHPTELLGNVLNDPSLLQEPSHLDLTFFKSVGTAIQDVMTADVVMKRAKEMGIGTEVDMS